MTRRSRGFTLVELLVVVGIVAVLLTILLPVLMSVRKAARSTACLAQLQGWGQAYSMYVGNHGVSTIPEQQGDDEMLRWWEILGPYVSDVQAALLCPEAREARTPLLDHLGSATQAWRKKTYVTMKPRVVRGNWTGSYGFNLWVYGRRPGVPQREYIQFIAKEAVRIPLVGDCVAPFSQCLTGDAIPKSLEAPEENSGDLGTSTYCIDRHKMAVNVVFLDGHAEHLPLASLWKLKWNENYPPSNVVIKG